MKTLTFTRYIYENARRYNNSINYAFTITKTIKFTQSTIFNQFYIIYNKLKIEFRRNLIILTKNTTINAFLQKIKIKKKFDEI